MFYGSYSWSVFHVGLGRLILLLLDEILFGCQLGPVNRQCCSAKNVCSDFYMLDLSITDRTVLKYLSSIVDSSTSHFSSINFCLTYFKALLLIRIKDCYAFIGNWALHYVMPLFMSDNFSLFQSLLFLKLSYSSFLLISFIIV